MCQNNFYKSSRRRFIHDAALTALGISVLPSATMCVSNNDDPEQRIKKAKAEGKLGIALVGLGNYAGGQLAPALLETKACYLAGIVTGTPSKAEQWKSQYKIPDRNIYDYQTFDQVKDNPDIDIIYVVLPNALHADFVIRAANAGKHVICEKPMAVTVKDCDNMIAARKKAGKMLSVGYRLHFEPHHNEMIRLAQQKTFGNIKKMSGAFGFNAAAGIWRLNKALAGGGPLMDVGIYNVQGFCYLTGLEPIAVRAQEGPKTDPEKFKEVEQSLTWQFQMPGGIIAEGKASYAEGMNMLRAEAERGWSELSPAYNYSGIRGRTSDGTIDFPQVNQQARQMDDFAEAIKNKRPSRVPGEMGRRDVKYLQAIYEAMQTGKRVVIPKG